MRNKHLHAFFAFSIGFLLLSCHSQLDVNNIDPTIEVPARLAVPFGSMSAKVADFFKTEDTAQFYIDTKDGKNLLTAQYTVPDQTQTVEGFDLSTQIGSATFKINLYNHLQNATYETPWGPVNLMQFGNQLYLPDGYTFSDSLRFNMPMALSGINKPTSDKRVDKAILPKVDFILKVDRKNFEDLDWNWVDRIELILGPQFVWPGHSNRVLLYKKGDPISQFGQEMELKMENVTLNLMKNTSLDPSFTNVYDSLQAQTIVEYTIPSGTQATINSESGIDCVFDVKKVEVDVLWGWFMPESGTTTRGLVDIDLSKLPFLETANLPIAEPQISAHLETPIAGNIKITIDSLYTVDAQDQFHFANFNGSRKGVLKYDETSGCISPTTSALTDVAKIKLEFDNTPAKGHIDSMFTRMPKKMGYNINLNFDQETCNQVRIVPSNLYATFGAHAKVPISFNKGTKIDYTARLENVNIGKYQIDSLLNEVKGIDSLKINDLWLYLGFENGIPLNVFGTFRCLDKDGKVIMDPMDPNLPYSIIPDQDTVRLAGGKYEPGTKKVVPVATPIVGRVTQQHLNLFPEIKTIVYTFGVDDKSLQDSQYGAEIKGSDNLKVNIGLTADIQAVLNVLNLTNKNNQ